MGFIKVLVIILVSYFLLCTLVFFKQRALIYYPVAASSVYAPATFDFENAGARILVDAVKRDGSDVVLYFGGNAEDVSYSRDEIASAFPDKSVYLMRYRGYGGSEGEASEEALVADAVALFDKVATHGAAVTVIGRSLGSGVATQLVAVRPAVQRLLLVTPFDSLVNVARSQFWFMPVSWLIRDRYESSRIAADMHVPATIIVAAKDTIIPLQRSQALYDAFPAGVAEFITIADAGHNTISMSARYLPALRGQKSLSN